MDRLFDLFERQGFRRLLILALLGGLIFAVRSMLDMFLLVFILSFIMNQLQNLILKSTSRFVKINPRLISIFLFTALILLVVFGARTFVPTIIHQSTQLIREAMAWYNNPPDHPAVRFILHNLGDIDLKSYADKSANFVVTFATAFTKGSINVLLAFILSLFFLLEKGRVSRFAAKLRTSKASAFYLEIEYFATRFALSFGKVMEAQLLIATINSILSGIALSFMGFREVFALSLLIFVLGLVPVAGVIISLIPLSLMAWNIGGPIKVLAVLIMVVVLHAIEAYVLNPKLMSEKTDLPVFYTFLILIVAEHFFGVWGLITGIPLFMFVLDLLAVDPSDKDHGTGPEGALPPHP